MWDIWPLQGDQGGGGNKEELVPLRCPPHLTASGGPPSLRGTALVTTTAWPLVSSTGTVVCCVPTSVASSGCY